MSSVITSAGMYLRIPIKDNESGLLQQRFHREFSCSNTSSSSRVLIWIGRGPCPTRIGSINYEFRGLSTDLYWNLDSDLRDFLQRIPRVSPFWTLDLQALPPIRRHKSCWLVYSWRAWNLASSSNSFGFWSIAPRLASSVLRDLLTVLLMIQRVGINHC